MVFEFMKVCLCEPEGVLLCWQAQEYERMFEELVVFSCGIHLPGILRIFNMVLWPSQRTQLRKVMVVWERQKTCSVRPVLNGNELVIVFLTSIRAESFTVIQALLNNLFIGQEISYRHFSQHLRYRKISSSFQINQKVCEV